MQFRSIAALLLMTAACTAQTSPPVQTGTEAAARRERTQARLRREGVPVNDWLPVIEDSKEARRRSAEEIADRALALLVVSMKASEVPESEWRATIRRYALDGRFTREERAFLAKADPDSAERAKFSWRVEAACTLLWSIGWIEKLGAPRVACAQASVRRLLALPDRRAILAASRLRPIGEILDEADLIYRYRWALEDKRVGGSPVPDWLDSDIAMERHQALNWLVENPGNAWDDVTLDT